MSKVKLRLSGGLAFAANTLSYLTGFIFSIFITRRLTEEEFGVWALIGSLINYGLVPFYLVSPWISRDAARGKKVLGPALALFLSLMPISLITYFVIASQYAITIECDPTIIIFGIIVLIPYIFLTLGNAIQSGYDPQTLGLAKIIFEISKIILGFCIVVALNMRLVGALTTLSIAYFLQTSILMYCSRPLFEKNIGKDLIIKWVKGVSISTVQVITNVIAATDIILMAWIIGHAEIAGYWQAAITASALVFYSSSLMSGLGPRLISGGTQRDLDKAFDFTMMFMIPLLSGFFLLSKDILWVLRPTYSLVWVASCILAVGGVMITLGEFGFTAVYGTDKFDVEDSLSIRHYLKSKVFILNKLELVLKSAYITCLATILVIAKSISLGIPELIILIASTNLMIAILKSVIGLKLMKKYTSLRLNQGNVIHYLIASTIMAIFVYILRINIGELPTKAIEAALYILPLIVIGAVIYGVVLYAINRDFRSFLREVYPYIAQSFRGKRP